MEALAAKYIERAYARPRRPHRGLVLTQRQYHARRNHRHGQQRQPNPRLDIVQWGLHMGLTPNRRNSRSRVYCAIMDWLYSMLNIPRQLALIVAALSEINARLKAIEAKFTRDDDAAS